MRVAPRISAHSSLTLSWRGGFLLRNAYCVVRIACEISEVLANPIYRKTPFSLMKPPANFEQWKSSVPDDIRKDVLWRMNVYQFALFAGDIAWFDVSKLMQDVRTRSLSEQLYRAVGSISANIAEGYSRGSGKDRARFYTYALGSARESRDWYHKSRPILGEKVVEHRIHLLTEIIRLLLTIIQRQRSTASFQEPPPEYRTSTSLLVNIPYT